MRVASAGQALLAATVTAFGVLGLITGDFTAIWQGVPKHLPAREALIYLCALVSLASGAALFWRRTASAASRTLFVFLLLWLLIVKGRYILIAPTVEGTYQSCGETAVIASGAWVLYAWFAADGDRRWLRFAVGERGLRFARMLYALAMLAFGLSHFVYLNLTAPLVPRWLPAHVFWAYFTGSAYLAAGTAMLIRMYARMAAALSALQMGLFTLLVWAPRLAPGHLGSRNWSEFALSWTLTICAWVVTESYRAMPEFVKTER